MLGGIQSREEFRNCVNCPRLHAGKHVAICVERELCSNVPEAIADDLDGDAGGEQSGRMRMAQVVKADRFLKP